MKVINWMRKNKWCLLVLVFSFVFSGCASNNTIKSEKNPAVSNTIQQMDVIYLARNLISSNASNYANKSIEKWGYPNFGEKLTLIGPKIYLQKGFVGAFSSTSDVNSNAANLFANSGHANGLLLEFKNGTYTKKGMVETVNLVLHANLYDKFKKTKSWSGQFRLHLGNDPAIGILKTTVVDDIFIENCINLVLNQMQKDGVLK